jgi:hypothetical protein
MTHPYTSLGPANFWHTAVSDRSAFDIEGLWKPKFEITPKMKIATSGSCFAQHFGRALGARGYNWTNFEPGADLLSEELATEYQYNTFSFRTGNIYTPKMLNQWLKWAFECETPPQEVWEKDGRFFDPLRPTVEPGGFETAEELFASRQSTFLAIRSAVIQADVFVFTMGLTESWRAVGDKVEYAICPGTVAGQFNDSLHEFHDHSFQELCFDMTEAVKFMVGRNAQLKVLLTVSPVPLAATATDQHVLLATSQSKAKLRAVAGELVDHFAQVDYFPSFEIATAPVFRGMFFAPDMRRIVPNGIDFIMQSFFKDQSSAFGNEPSLTKSQASDADDPDPYEIRCEEEYLAAFGE